MRHAFVIMMAYATLLWVPVYGMALVEVASLGGVHITLLQAVMLDLAAVLVVPMFFIRRSGRRPVDHGVGDEENARREVMDMITWYLMPVSIYGMARFYHWLLA